MAEVLLERLKRRYYRLLLDGFFDRKRLGNVPSPAGRVPLRCLPNPPVRWLNGIAMRPVMSHRLWVHRSSRGWHEPSLDNLVARCLKPGDVVVDIGAQIGITAVMEAIRVGPHGRVIAFEPDADNYPVLLEAIRLNGLTTVEPHCLAAASKAGRLRFAKEATAGLIQRAQAQDGGEWLEAVDLDTFLAEHGPARVDFVKIDVDGPEMDVVLGMRRLLGADDAPFLCVECSRYWGRFGHDFAGAFELFAGLGFKVAVALRRSARIEWLSSPGDIPADWGMKPAHAFNFFCFRPELHAERIRLLEL